MATEERWARVNAIFDRALDLPIDQRASFVARACDGDDTLAAEVQALIDAHARADGFLEAPVFEAGLAVLRPTTRVLEAGYRIGPYAVVREIGRGGMGAVYLATRADDTYRKQVAVKVIGRAMESRAALQRFHTERQILASLDHPNIAKLLDGGTTSDGTAYLVMEYVDGVPLIDYCDARALPLHDRLRLFQKICSAVHHAHQNLVVHRDLKPGNILVTADGDPKLLDFGIAKLLGDNAVVADLTSTIAPVMTPDYASPEQVRGLPVTTASDVYSLGVVLYRLLVGVAPYRLSGSPAEMERTICDTTVQRPSERVARTDRRRRALSGDIDTIVMTAMHRDPQRRYASAAELSLDIGRFLDGLPVVARGDSAAYRLRKFVARHKAPAAAAVIVVLSLVGGVIATATAARAARRQQARAERRFEDVRRLANSLLFEINDSVQNLAGSTPTRELLVRRALEYLDGLAQESHDDPTLQRELATAYERVGDIQGNPYGPNLGDTEGALASYREALSIRDALGSAGRALDAQIELAITYRSIGDVLDVKGDGPGTLAQYKRSLAILEQVAEDPAAPAAARNELARAYETLGDGLNRHASRREALEQYRRSLALVEAASREKPEDRVARRRVAIALMKLGEAYVDNREEGLGSFRRSIELLRSIADAEPDNARIRREMSVVQNRFGEVLMELGEYESAVQTLSDATAIRRDVASADPTNLQAQFDLAVVRANLGQALARAGRPRDGETIATQGLEALERLVAGDPSNMVFVRNLALSADVLGLCHARQGANPGLDAATRRRHWTESRAAYLRARTLFADLEARQASRPADREALTSLPAKIAEAERALASF